MAAMGSLRICLLVALVAVVSTVHQNNNQDRDSWFRLGQIDLESALNMRDNWNVAKNIVFLLGDGMGLPVVTASRIYKGQKEGMNGEEGYLAWERFPNVALLKTYNVDRQVPDSGGTATAFLSGIKANYLTVGVGPEVQQKDCEAARKTSSHAISILEWAQDQGLDTGFVTSTRITHATPACLYAHSADRDWECDQLLGAEGRHCKDIADQLVNDKPGNNIKVIMGGGRQAFGAGLDPASVNTTCTRQDGRNLVKEWLEEKQWQGQKAKYVTTAQQLKKLRAKKTDYLLGLFDDSHLPYLATRGPDTPVPTLAAMTKKALQILRKSKEGFFLMVEGGRIDQALHVNSPYLSLEETLDFDKTVSNVLKMVDLEETLVVVTADHSHVMTINGYPFRGNDILGVVNEVSDVDGLPYSTLSFTNGPGYNYTTDGVNVTRRDPSRANSQTSEYKSQAAVPLSFETHGGEDVAAWAAGPMSHLFHRTHEQNYVAHVLAYAACVGPSAGDCARPAHATFTRPGTKKRPAEISNHKKNSQTRRNNNNNDNLELQDGLTKYPTISPDLQTELDLEAQELIRGLGEETVPQPVRLKEASGEPAVLPYYHHL